MAQDEASTAVAERPQAAVDASEPLTPAAIETGKQRKKKQKDEAPEYEIEFDTPFGKIEFEVEPASSKERRDKQKREKAEREAAKAAAKAAKKAEGKLAKRESSGGGRGRSLLAVLVIFAIIASLVAIAIWLFASPGPKEQDEIPEEYLQPGVEPAAEPEGFAAKMRTRIRHAVRAGRQASREAQQEQERRFKDLTHGR